MNLFLSQISETDVVCVKRERDKKLLAIWCKTRCVRKKRTNGKNQPYIQNHRSMLVPSLLLHWFKGIKLLPHEFVLVEKIKKNKESP